MRILTVAGTRPELIKLSPLVPLLDERFEHRYLFTGQHYSDLMVDGLLADLPVRVPEHTLAVRSSQLDELQAAVDGEVADFRPDVMLVYGDTNSTLAAARSAHSARLRLIHIEAGVRSFDLTMVEERNRVEIDRLADLRLAPTALSQWFLTHLEGYALAGCPVVGNLGVDAWARYGSPAADGETDTSGSQEQTPFALLTLHRPDTVDRSEVLEELLVQIGRLPLRVLFPVHPRTRKRLQGLAVPGNVRVLQPLPYRRFCSLLREAAVVLTDSGGVQEEAATCGTACVTLRPNTDRPESILLGMNRLFPPGGGGDLRSVVEAARHDAVHAHPTGPYGDGRAAMRITTLLEAVAGREPSFESPSHRGLAGDEELRQGARFLLDGADRRLRVVG